MHGHCIILLTAVTGRTAELSLNHEVEGMIFWLLLCGENFGVVFIVWGRWWDCIVCSRNLGKPGLCLDYCTPYSVMDWQFEPEDFVPFVGMWEVHARHFACGEYFMIIIRYKGYWLCLLEINVLAHVISTRMRRWLLIDLDGSYWAILIDCCCITEVTSQLLQSTLCDQVEGVLVPSPLLLT